MRLIGSLVALVTPMNDDQSIDYDALSELIEWHSHTGTDGLVILGTTGESATVTPTERRELISFVRSHITDHCALIVGTGSSSTQVALSLTQEAYDLGADAALLVTPCYVKPTQQGLYAHYKYIADHCDCPQILYNVPSRSGCDLLSSTVAQLAQLPNVVGLKDATGDLDRLQELLAIKSDIVLLSGDDATAAEFMLAGGHGVISVSANVVPDTIKQLCDAASKGDVNVTQELNQSLATLNQALFVESNPIPVKWLLSRMQKIKPTLRLPLTLLSQDFHTLFDELSNSMNLLPMTN